MTGTVEKNTSHNTSYLTFERIYTIPEVHPYDTVEWVKRDVVSRNWRDNEVNFAQYGVYFPSFWSDRSVQIFVTKYFRGALDTSERETDLRQVINRVVETYTQAGIDNGYFSSIDDESIFSAELTYILLHQIATFNSPVWFNVGTKSPQQISACFLLSVEDSMESILNWYREEGLIFKGGSGAGVNLSRVRSSKELLSSGGYASGPVSFMRGADASAGTIKSGGATRRAAKMVILDVDHPDIEEFVETKQREEQKIRTLRDAGFDMDLGGRDVSSVQYQNANNSVRVSNEFMRAVENDTTFDLRARTTGRVIDTINARKLYAKMCQAAWECADPGIQYDDTINEWHTCPNSGRINTSNPCSEYMHLDNSSCNLASLNLLKFLRPDSLFDTVKFTAVTKLLITAMDISVCFADFPTKKITDTTRAYRQLGLGYANLGALLMAVGLPYDSDDGRALAGAITSLLTAVSYGQSANLANCLEPYDGFLNNKEAHLQVITKHLHHNNYHAPGSTGIHSPIWAAASHEWDQTLRWGATYGYRNAQVSLLAPTGTTGLAMGVDTTGIEPPIGLVTTRKLVDGGSISIILDVVTRALEYLGYSDSDISTINDYINNNGTVHDAPVLNKKHYSVFDCAFGTRSISPMGHVEMMAAVQPFLSGAISKTVNMPSNASVRDIEEIYTAGWLLGLKSLAVYRDNCKVGQPHSLTHTTEPVVENAPVRRRLPRSRVGTTVSFTVGDSKGYLTCGEYSDGSLGEIFLKMSKPGTTLAGVMDAFAISVSIGLQYGVPLETFVRKFVNMRFEPAGITNDPDIRIAHSIMDYIVRCLALRYLPQDVRSPLGVYSVDERVGQLGNVPLDNSAQYVYGTHIPNSEVKEINNERMRDAPMCNGCGVQMIPAGSCYVCGSCGTTSGCS